jgi:hypothetical protein
MFPKTRTRWYTMSTHSGCSIQTYLELFAEDGLAAGAVAGGEVAALPPGAYTRSHFRST